MKHFLEIVGNPLYYGIFLTLLGPFTVALIYRRLQGNARSKREDPDGRMSAKDDLLRENQRFARRFDLQRLPARPARRLAVVTCMDARLPVERLLGLTPGEAHIIRNAGGIVTEDAIRSLLVSHYLLGTEEFLIINHSDCRMMTFKDEELSARLQCQTGKQIAITFHAFSDLEDNVRRQVQKLKAHPWIPRTVRVRGFVYDVSTGLLQEVTTPCK